MYRSSCKWKRESYTNMKSLISISKLHLMKVSPHREAASASERFSPAGTCRSARLCWRSPERRWWRACGEDAQEKLGRSAVRRDREAGKYFQTLHLKLENRCSAVIMYSNMLYYIGEDIMEARILRDACCHLGSHACSQLIHERQKLVGGDLLHPFLKHKTMGALW